MPKSADQRRTPAPARKRKSGGPKKMPWVWVIPAVILGAGFHLVAPVSAIWYAFTDWNGLSSPNWIGLDNFDEIFSGGASTTPLWNTLKMVAVTLIPKPRVRDSHQSTSIETLFAGVRYIMANRVVLGAISLDLFAVLLGGAYALLPIYAKDILHAGPIDLGVLRGAPGVGAIMVAILLSRFPIRDRAGHLLFICVAGFGFFVCLFGFSTSIWIAAPSSSACTAKRPSSTASGTSASPRVTAAPTADSSSASPKASHPCSTTSRP